MADYKSIIKGTINSVTSKAKQYVEGGGLKDAYDKGSTAARCYANIAKLSLQINGELEEQKKVFIEIGRLCYDENRNDPQGNYVPLFDELKAIDERIEVMREELEAAKAAVEAAKVNSAADGDNSVFYTIDFEDTTDE